MDVPISFDTVQPSSNLTFSWRNLPQSLLSHETSGVTLGQSRTLSLIYLTALLWEQKAGGRTDYVHHPELHDGRYACKYGIYNELPNERIVCLFHLENSIFQ